MPRERPPLARRLLLSPRGHSYSNAASRLFLLRAPRSVPCQAAVRARRSPGRCGRTRGPPVVGHGGLGGAYRAGGSVGRGCQRSVSFWSRQQAARGGAPPSGALGFVRRPPTHQPAADDDDLLRHGCSPRATARGRPSFWHPKTARHTGGGWEVSAVPRVLHRCKYSACVCQPFCRVLRSPSHEGSRLFASFGPLRLVRATGGTGVPPCAAERPASEIS